MIQIHNCRMRYGKVALQLGTHQKYYISRCKEKQSIQLTITVSEKDVVKCLQERGELIDTVTEQLKDIMKVFMPAAMKPNRFVPCPLCSTLHITLEQVENPNTIFCPNTDSDEALENYYYDLRPKDLTSKTMEITVTTYI